MLTSFTIEDDLSDQDHGAVEVIVHLEDGIRRWCYFMTPTALSNCGDWVDGTEVPIHYDSPYMVVVAGRLDEVLIERALRHIDSHRGLIACTMPLAAK